MNFPVGIDYIDFPGSRSVHRRANQAMSPAMFAIPSNEHAYPNSDIYGAYANAFNYNIHPSLALQTTNTLPYSWISRINGFKYGPYGMETRQQMPLDYNHDNYPSPSLQPSTTSPYHWASQINGLAYGPQPMTASQQPLPIEYHISTEQGLKVPFEYYTSPTEQRELRPYLPVDTPFYAIEEEKSVGSRSSTVASREIDNNINDNNDNDDSDNNDTSIPSIPETGPTFAHRPQRREKDMNSKLQKKLALKGGPIGDNRQVIGDFRRVCAAYGMWKDVDHPTERKATYHSDIRSQLIALDAAQNEAYNVEPAAGHHKEDITSRCTFNKGWTEDHHTVVDRHGNKVLLMSEEPANFITQHPPNMTYRHPIHGELTVIDHNNHAVRDFKDVPRAISSEIEAWRIEGLQRTTGVSIPDLRARMPRACENKDGTLFSVQGPTALTNRTARWRKRENVATWRRKGRRASKKV